MLKKRLSGIPLRLRLVAIISLLLAAGLGIAGIATTTVVSNFLVRQVDNELHAAALDPSEVSQATAQGLPSDYFVLVQGEEDTIRTLGLWAVARFGKPDLPTLTYEEAVARGGEPFTVPAAAKTAESESWRAITLVGTLQPSGERAIIYVALPLIGMDQTVSILTRTLLISGLGIVLLGGFIAWILVERSLRSLRSVEHTAAQIAAGDLSQRVPEAPPSTEMGSLAASLNAMLTQIERAFAAQETSEARMRQFVSDASHELRTPVATIRGYGELYRMGALDTREKVDDTMFRVEDSARRMSTLVNDLLVLARLDEGRPLARESVDLAALAKDSAQDLHALDPARQVTIVPLIPDPSGEDSADLIPQKLLIEGDSDRLRQVLTNLIGNVARHTPPGTPVDIALGIQLSTEGSNDEEPESSTLATSESDGHSPDRENVAVGTAVSSGDTPPEGVAVLEVRDHGPGLTEEQSLRIFERFYRADSSRTRESGGSGLGMAIVAAIVGTHGGHVEVIPTVGGGLTVRITLPL